MAREGITASTYLAELPSLSTASASGAVGEGVAITPAIDVSSLVGLNRVLGLFVRGLCFPPFVVSPLALASSCPPPPSPFRLMIRLYFNRCYDVTGGRPTRNSLITLFNVAPV